MSNERIDLTQFEKRENGEYKVEASIGDYTRYMYEDETDIALSKQLNMLPDLITELKRCYELIDRLQMHVDPAWKTYDKQVNAKYSNNEASE